MIIWIVVLASLFVAIIVLLVAWKYTKFGRLLKPRLKPKEVKLEDLIVPVSDNSAGEHEGGDVDLNPVLQAKMLLEADTGKKAGRTSFRKGAQGALRRLLRSVGGSFGAGEKEETARKKKDKLKQIDRDLAKEGQHAEAIARAKAEEERVYRQAERAAMEARRM